MRNIFFLLFFSFTLAANSQTNTLDSAWIRDNYYKIERLIPMRDGKKLFTAIYIPKDTTEKHPILLTRTPYSVSPYGENNFADFWNNYKRLYMRENYIIVRQDVRGRYMSEGDFVDVRPFNPNKTGTQSDEASDSYDAIDWLVKNVPHNNGRVGAFGISYPGFYSTMVALSGHPAVKAVSPQAPVTDWFHGDDFHHNGAFMLMDAFSFYSGFGKPRPKPTTHGSPGFSMPHKDNYRFYLETGALQNFSKLMGSNIQFWNDLFAHPNLDDWWKARNPMNVAEQVPATTNTLVVGGLFDAEDVYGAWNLYKAIEQKAKNNNKLVMGPWFHGQWAGNNGTFLGNTQFGQNTSEWYQNNVEVPFFNYHLKNKGDISKLAEATIFFSGENKWHQFAQWPPADAQTKNLYLQTNGALGWSKPNISGSFSQYTSDPAKPVPYAEHVHEGRTREYMTDDQRFAARRPDVLVFQTDVLQNDVTVAGPLHADLFASISTTDADFVVKLIDVFPDTFKYNKPQQYRLMPDYPMEGYQMLVRGEIMRGKYRKSFEKPEPFTPGKVEQVKFYLPDVAHTFKKGHRIMVQVQSSWFPLVDRNPQKFVNIYGAAANDFQKADIKIYHSSQYPSSVILPVLK